MALAGKPESGYYEKLFAERSDLSLFGKALLLKALFYGKGPVDPQKVMLEEILNKLKVTPETAHFEEDESAGGQSIYASNLRTSALILQTLIETGVGHPLLPAMARWLVQKLEAGPTPTTQEDFYAFYALNDYYLKAESTPAEFRATISLAGKPLIDAALRAADRQPKLARVKLADLSVGGGRVLDLAAEKTGAGTLYYGSRLTYAPKTKLAPRDEGIAVTKRIESQDGRPLAAITPGSLVVITLEIAVPQESLYVVVDDPLPAGLEAVNPTFLTESDEATRKLDDLTGDASEPWWEGFNHVEMRDDRVVLFADSLMPGVHVHRYLARALTLGEFIQPGTKAAQMYAPEVFGRSAEGVVRIGK